jgi:hypothetical protein
MLETQTYHNMVQLRATGKNFGFLRRDKSPSLQVFWCIEIYQETRLNDVKVSVHINLTTIGSLADIGYWNDEWGW